ncbi:hypothetical protein [uncultured Alistipes sp.]|jgi:hypothetical protein|uniref:hypothetical protein n=1 Tax=Alistipes finegoldii TaxID=214856 RepID=UPI002594E1A3|nr:hypothetical protein [uncultured Alistipes sp.]
MKRETKVTLITADGMTQEFTPEHAERLLRMPRNGGWKLPENSPFIFTPAYGIDRRRNTRPDKVTASRRNQE